MTLSSLCLLLAAVLASSSFAGVLYTYTYTGEDFGYSTTPSITSYGSTTSDNVSGSITLTAPLPDGTTTALITAAHSFAPTVVSFSFTDGVTTWSNTTLNATYINGLYLTTDASGNVIDDTGTLLDASSPLCTVVEWGSTMLYPLTVTPGWIHPSVTFTFYDNVEYLNLAGLQGTTAWSFTPGTWELTTSTGTVPVPFPEPTTMLLLGSGLLGLAGLWRKFKK